MKLLESFNDSKYILSDDEQIQSIGGAQIVYTYKIYNTEDPDTCETSSDMEHTDVAVQF